MQNALLKFGYCIAGHLVCTERSTLNSIVHHVIAKTKLYRIRKFLTRAAVIRNVVQYVFCAMCM
jgi:hypothetical protein